MRDVRAANRIATGGLVPDITFLLEAPLDVTLRRATERPDEGERRFEAEGRRFHRRVHAGFRRLALREPHRWTVVDTAVSELQAHEAIWARVRLALAAMRGSPLQ